MLSFLDQRKEAKMQRLQDPNRNHVRHEAGKQCKNNEKEYLKSKIDELAPNSKIKKYLRRV
jgi:hypothetical protein